jgi:uncharacterized membrane protein
VNPTDRNRAEWENPANWRGRGLFACYYAPRDPRVWVPKRIEALGWTLNFAHRASWYWLVGLVGLPLVVVGLTVWLVESRR